MQRPPTFSVVVPTYNQAKFLGQALDSLLAQTCGDWEAIVVNDGSTDDTPSIMRAYAEKDDRFRLVHKENGGVGSALNGGIRRARGPWICWLSSDDLFEERKLEIHRRWFERHPDCQFFFTYYDKFLEERKELQGRRHTTPRPDHPWQVLGMLHRNFIFGNSICARRTILMEAEGFDETLRYAQDYDCWLRLLARHPSRQIPEKTCITRVHADQGTRLVPGAGGYDGAKSDLRFLNQSRFEDLVQGADLTDPGVAREALTRAIRPASDPRAVIYRLGPHPALILRILEWAWHGAPASIAGSLQESFRRQAAALSRQWRGTRFGLVWKAAAASTRRRDVRFVYRPIEPAAVGEAHCFDLRARGSPESEQVRSYLLRFEGREVPEGRGRAPRRRTEILFLSRDSLLPAGGAGSTPPEGPLVTVAQVLQKAGHRILQAHFSEDGLAYRDGLLLLGLEGEGSWPMAFRDLGTADALVEVLGSETSGNGGPKRRILLCLEPTVPAPLKERVPSLNRMEIAVLCSSAGARDELIEAGLRKEGVQLLPDLGDPSGREEAGRLIRGLLESMPSRSSWRSTLACEVPAIYEAMKRFLIGFGRQLKLLRSVR